MRHKRGNKKLSKPTDQRIALLRSLSLSLIEYGKIKTTTVRAKEAKRYVEKLITLSKKDDLHSRRLALKLLPNKLAVKRLFEEISPKVKTRNGGYTRLIPLGFRRGDAASLSQLELVD